MNADAETSPIFLLNSRQAAAALAVSEATIFRLLKRGDLPAVRIGAALRFDTADVRQFIERHKAAEGRRAGVWSVSNE